MSCLWNLTNKCNIISLGKNRCPVFGKKGILCHQDILPLSPCTSPSNRRDCGGFGYFLFFQDPKECSLSCAWTSFICTYRQPWLSYLQLGIILVNFTCFYFEILSSGSCAGRKVKKITIFKQVVPNLFGTRDQSLGRQLFHGPVGGMVLGWFKCITFIVLFISIIILSTPPQTIRH